MGCPIEHEKSDSHSSARKNTQVPRASEEIQTHGDGVREWRGGASQAACLLVHSGTEITSQKLWSTYEFRMSYLTYFNY